jgi:hypothetical protein
VYTKYLYITAYTQFKHNSHKGADPLMTLARSQHNQYPHNKTLTPESLHLCLHHKITHGWKFGEMKHETNPEPKDYRSDIRNTRIDSQKIITYSNAKKITVLNIYIPLKKKIRAYNEVDKHNRMTRTRKRTVLSFTAKKNKETIDTITNFDHSGKKSISVWGGSP